MHKFDASFLNQDLFGVYLLLLVLYSTLVGVQTYANTKVSHPVTRLLAANLAVEMGSKSQLHYVSKLTQLAERLYHYAA